MAAYQYLKGACRKDGEQLLAPTDNDRSRQNGFKLQEGSRMSSLLLVFAQ